MGARRSDSNWTEWQLTNPLHKPSMKTKTTLTIKQSTVLGFIKSFLKTHDRFPFRREICAEFGWSGTYSAEFHLKALVRKGFVEKDTDQTGAAIRGAYRIARNPPPFMTYAPKLKRVPMKI